MIGTNYNITITSLLDLSPSQTESSFTFWLDIISLAITPPPVNNSIINTGPSCLTTIEVG